ncbi:hypothetical protein [Azoarcus sp. KH32C]|uniref:hypothetical protein n=1 Tax=Azoarcus sp. KH32C TaxID=748247 RepID=UPI0002385C26|nr:hypothetical protein [Azoarcus sp. KH32C]BAL26865.1 hypothetical protein AZKH_4592 [Azoarcus sp. KH32C]
MTLRTILAAGAVCLLTQIASAADLIVIAHPDAKITGADVQDIFLGAKQFAGSLKLTPVDNGPAQEQFLKKALQIDATKYNSVWTKKSFREGLNPPPVKSGDLEVIDFVRKTPGAVGYVTSPADGVTVVNKY